MKSDMKTGNCSSSWLGILQPRRFLALSAIAILSILCGAVTRRCNADNLDWLKKDRIRAGYGGIRESLAEMEALFAKLQANGFNAYFAKTDFDVSTKEKSDEFAAKVDAAQRHNLRFFVVCNFLGGGAEPKILAGCKLRYTQADGPRMKTACPLDGEFWGKSVRDRALDAAKMSKAHPALAGFIVDPEMYGADTTAYGAPCLCDECFKKYLLSALCTAIAPKIPLQERIPYLKKREAEKEYEVLQAADVGMIAKGIRNQVREASPDFLLGCLLFYPGMTWFGDAVMKQWATEEVPVLLAPEKTYFVGYSKALVDAPVEKLKAAGINAIFLPGIGWDARYPCIEPEQLPAHLYFCATHADGYWVWHVPSLNEKAPAAELNEKYWAAFKAGNEEIVEWSASGGKYETELKLELAPPSVMPDAVARFVKSAKSFAAVSEGKGALENPEKLTRLRGGHQMVVLVRPGEGLSVQATAHRLADLPGPCGYFVFDSEGKELKRGQFDVGQPGLIEIPDAKPGSYLVAITSRGPTYSLLAKNVLASIEAAPLHPCAYSRPLHFFVPKGVTRFSIQVKAEPLSETALAKVFAPDGKLVVQDTSVNKGPFTMDVSVPAGMDGKVWRVELTKGEIGIYEDILLSFSKEIPPFVAEDPARLIVPR